MGKTTRFLLVATLAFGLPACATHRAAPTLELADAPAAADQGDQEVAWVCPMHSDQTSHEPGKCPRCGMALVLGTPFDMRDARLEFETVPAIPKAGEKLTLTFKVFHPGSGEPIKDFELVHEMPYHLFVISQDMEFFQHIHPQQADDGTWSIDVVLPKPGAYALLSDFAPKGGSAQFLARPLITAGYTGDLIAQSAPLVPDAVLNQTVDDLTATVSLDPAPMVAGSYGHLTFHLTKAGTNEPIRELQTYLGAYGHMLIMNEDMVDYVHSHPVEMPSPELKVEDLRGGPDVIFEGLMPKPGRYRAWSQFRYKDKIYTFVNTFEVFDVGQRVAR